MPITSASTYSRVFAAESKLYHAAGNYENKLGTKLAKGIVGALTLGIGYGLIRLIEHYHNVLPKMEEYRANAENIYHSLARTLVTEEQVVRVTLADKRVLKLEQVVNKDDNESYVRISEGKHVEVIKGNFKDILIRLSREFESAPGIYDVSNDYKPPEFFMEMCACKIAEVINYIPSKQQYKNLYGYNLDNIYTALLQASNSGESSAKVALCGGEEVEFLTFLNPDSGQSMVRVINGEQVIELESTFVSLCQDMDFLIYLRDADKEAETFEVWVNKNKNSAGAIPPQSVYDRDADCMADAVAKRLADATQRFNATYGINSPSGKTPLIFKE
ncbi:hypothetical protein [Salmonella bongori]|uniref:Cytoplasmic protein n=1 Tax=Salmonella bongori serovar 44:r:- TaxID=1967585 RepID=A0A702BX54_SALBN|nr:hypothetical protein [Salmonella bongori]AID24904.1 effector protein steA [Salmonella bongori serovar 48:z41:-- str. RKS3044]EGS1128576.1 hypothetical protein [Salmonella bongori CFSAN000509]MBA2136298.1 hypothetical protein [Salmonella bongori serovar 66:z39:-]HAC6693980.1 hypothetical protein [Salmonella bongori serovar 44:r:-]